MFRFFFVASLVNVHAALQWTPDTPQDNTQLVVCSGNDIELPWNYTLSPGERIEDIKWTYQASGRADEVIALYAADNFVVMPAFSGRVQYMGEGAIVIQGASLLESGNYTVVINSDNADGMMGKFEKTVYVQFADFPHTLSSVLDVHQNPDAIYDNVSGQYHVQLSCGVLTDPGHPSVQVVWVTPEGRQLQSSSVHNGTFYLLVPNPPSGGNYTCTLPPLSPATVCLPSDSPLLPGASVIVDEVKARFSLLEAKVSHQAEAQDQMKAENDRLRQYIDVVKNESHAELQAENEELRHQLQALRNEAQSNTSSLQSQLNVTTRLVAFHARLSSSLTLSTNGQRLEPFHVIYSAGAAFNSTSGEFTAPFPGTYYFVGSTGSFANNKWSTMSLMKSGSEVSLVHIQQQDSYDNMGSCHATLHLTAGEKVWLQSWYNGTNFYYYRTTTFSGFLIHADV